MTKEKLYNPDEVNSFAVQFGTGMSTKNDYPKTNKRIDKRTKAYGKQRVHKGEMGKYKSKK